MYLCFYYNFTRIFKKNYKNKYTSDVIYSFFLTSCFLLRVIKYISLKFEATHKSKIVEILIIFFSMVNKVQDFKRKKAVKIFTNYVISVCQEDISMKIQNFHQQTLLYFTVTDQTDDLNGDDQE